MAFAVREAIKGNFILFYVVLQYQVWYDFGWREYVHHN
jgi:hypothetical protein